MNLDAEKPLAEDIEQQCQYCGETIDGDIAMTIHLLEEHNVTRPVQDFNDGRYKAKIIQQ